MRRPAGASLWCATVGFFLTWGLMRLFVENWDAPYLPAQILTTGLVMFWSFAGKPSLDFSHPPASES